MHGVVLSNFCPCSLQQFKMIETAIHDCVDVSVIVCGWRSDPVEKCWPMEVRAQLLAQELQSSCQIYKSIPETLTYDLQAEGILESRERKNWRRFTDGIEHSISMTSTPLMFYTDEPRFVKPLMSLNFQVKYVNCNDPRTAWDVLQNADYRDGWDLITKTFYVYYRTHILSEYKLAKNTSITSTYRPYGK